MQRKDSEAYFTIKDWGYKYTLYLHICYRKYVLSDNLKSIEEAKEVIKNYQKSL